MTSMKELHKKWMRDPEYRREYAALEEEFAFAATTIEARSGAEVTPEQLAERSPQKTDCRVR